MSALKALKSMPQRPPLKRSFVENLDHGLQEPVPKRRRDWLTVCDWLNSVPPPTSGALADTSRSQTVPAAATPSKALAEISRSQSVPPEFDDNQAPSAVEDLLGTLKSPSAIDESGDHRNYDLSRCDNDSSSQPTDKSSITKIKTTSIRYRSVLEFNNVEIDPTGSKISQEVRNLLETDILKKRASPPLPQDLHESTGESINKWGSTPKHVLNSFVSSPIFPIHQAGISPEGNTLWPRAALPSNQDYRFPISTPKPDYHVGYDIGVKSGFSAQQFNVIDHPQAQPYTQPGTGNVLPFLIVELKSEATGGTLYHAENQAAGSGTYSQRAMEWLLDQAKAPQQNRETDTVTFSITGTGRLVILSVHWHSLKDQMYYMSYVKGFLSSEPEQIQACHSTVKNIIEWGLGKRRSKLGDVLQQLFPLTQQWTEKRTITAAAELDDPGDDDNGAEAEVIQSVPRRAAKSRRSGPKDSRRSSSNTQSFTPSPADRRSKVTEVTSVTEGPKSHTPKPPPR